MHEPNLYYCCALVALGILAHFVMKLSELENQGQIITPWEYLGKHPYTSVSVVLFAYLFMIMQAAMLELSYTAAIMTGLACNSIGDKFRARATAVAEAKIDKIG